MRENAMNPVSKKVDEINTLIASLDSQNRERVTAEINQAMAELAEITSEYYRKYRLSKPSNSDA
jgi:methyl-accepting chemotaxis protein